MKEETEVPDRRQEWKNMNGGPVSRAIRFNVLRHTHGRGSDEAGDFLRFYQGGELSEETLAETANLGLIGPDGKITDRGREVGERIAKTDAAVKEVRRHGLPEDLFRK